MNLKLKPMAVSLAVALTGLSGCGGSNPDHVATVTTSDGTKFRCETFINTPSTSHTDCAPVAQSSSTSNEPEAVGGHVVLPEPKPAPVAPATPVVSVATKTPSTPAQITSSIAQNPVQAAQSSQPVPQPTPSAQTPLNPVLTRAFFDQPDSTAKNIHVIYAVPASAQDRQRDTDGSILTTLSQANAWFKLQHNSQFVFDNDITFVQLNKTDDYYQLQGLFEQDTIEAELVSRNLINPDKRYIVFMEGSHPRLCGESPINTNYIVGRASIVYLNAPNCSALHYIVAHELFHNFGAPHTNNPNDIMYEGFLDPYTTKTISDVYYSGINKDYIK